MRTALFASLLVLAVAATGTSAMAARGRHATHTNYMATGKDRFGGPKDTGCVPTRKGVNFEPTKSSKSNLPPCPPKH